MKRIAIISPCMLPVPASKGGAVESLITKIIEDNERYQNFIIDLYTIDDEQSDSYSFSYTNVIVVKPDRLTKVADKLSDKYYRTVNADSSSRFLDCVIANSFFERLADNQENYDMVIIENMMSTACEIVRICNGKYTFPIFFHMHNDVDMYRSPKQIRELVRFGVRFLAVSDYIKDQIRKCDPKAVVSTLYNGVNIKSIERYIPRDDDTITVLYAGRIIPDKGVKELVRAFTMMLDNLNAPDKDRIKLTLIGFSGFDSKYENEIHSLADKYTNIKCINQVPAEEMAFYYSEADIVVMPSLVDEAFGMVTIEAMSKGIPLIITDSGALPEVAGDGAYIVSWSGNITKNLADAIQKVAFNPELRGELSKRGYDRAHSIKAFDIDNYYHNFAKEIEPEEITSDDVISVIVPVYNVSNYLKRCVSSITEQTYRNIEIILVDDGSTDESGAFCDEIVETDGRIKVFHQDNQGLSGARNTGIDNATGRYVFFCDSDDYLQTDALEKMLGRLKRDNADVVACGIANVFDTDGAQNDKSEIFTSPNPGRWSGRESVIQMMRTNNVCTVAWNKLYKEELFENVRFPLGVQNEDEATTYKLLYKAKIVSFLPETLYKYYQRELSIMHENLEDRYKFFLKAAKDRMGFFQSKGDSELEQHSRISLLEWIKYSYRNIENKEIKRELLEAYKGNVGLANVPSVMGIKKQMALLAWKYLRY
ncbi:MAG: glycosyltransferase [Butyrivibrio sp.]|nr:glycosyltransferase [Butyrivibrio sp.]